MSYETVPSYERLPETDEHQYEQFRHQTETMRRVEESQVVPESAGGLALRLIMGGAMLSGGVMPTTEAVTLELLAATTEVADQQREERLAA